MQLVHLTVGTKEMEEMKEMKELILYSMSKDKKPDFLYQYEAAVNEYVDKLSQFYINNYTPEEIKNGSLRYCAGFMG